MNELSRRDLLAGAAGVALAVPMAPLHARTSDGEAAAEAVLAQIAEDMLRDYPEQATYMGVDKDARADLKRRLSDKSPEGQEKAAGRARAALKTLARIDLDQMADPWRTHVAVVRAAYQTAAEGFAFPYGDVATLTSGWRNTPYAVAQNVGAYLDTPQLLTTDHKIDNPADADAYLARMEGYAAQLDGETARVQDAAGRGVILPDFALAKATKQLRIARGDSVDAWDMVTSLEKRTKEMLGDHAARARKIAQERIAPALKRQITALEALVPKATSDAGIWKLPDGDAWYAWGLRAATTTRLTPDEVHKQGREELRALTARMDVLLKAEGYSTGPVGARMTALEKDPRYRFAEGDPGRAEIMAYLREKIADIRTRMPRAFHTLVPGHVEVTRMSPAAEPGAPGAYGGPGTIDGKEPGRFWINLGTTSRWSRFSLPDLAYHEAIPGHVWQGEYTFRQPLIRTMLGFSAYSEGWALYAEQIADELGVYDDFPAGRLGYLQSLAFRACRMVVDTGLHAKRWTREEAIRFFVEENGSNAEEVTSEVERYCTWPGQACGYKLGHSFIAGLRDRTQTRLGAKYDFRAFNDTLVLGGNVPLTVLEQRVEAMVAAAEKAAITT